MNLWTGPNIKDLWTWTPMSYKGRPVQPTWPETQVSGAGPALLPLPMLLPGHSPAHGNRMPPVSGWKWHQLRMASLEMSVISTSFPLLQGESFEVWPICMYAFKIFLHRLLSPSLHGEMASHGLQPRQPQYGARLRKQCFTPMSLSHPPLSLMARDAVVPLRNIR